MDQLFVVRNSWLIPLLPLLGAIVAGLFGARWLRERSHWPIWLGVGASAALSFVLLFGMLGRWGQGPALEAPGERAALNQESERHALSASTTWYEWIAAGNAADEHVQAGQRPSYFRAAAGSFIDPLTAVMLCIITGIGFLITIFSKGYMAGEEGYFRFFAFLGLFIFAMTILVLGENLVMLYLGWEGVGLCSYLLIGYYYQRPAARDAAQKAFVVNRIGDFGFAIGIMLCFLVFGTVSFYGAGPTTLSGVLTRAADPTWMAALAPWQQRCAAWIPFCLMLGAFGKSAQFPLYVWLPDAMEGPTPVSALIHAATMVTAGVYMIARCSTLFAANHAALMLIAAVGTLTALFAAIIAMRQFDLKKVFAYSTVSQLGYMFVGVAVLAPVAGVFHLLTHAFFKALLFLSSGVVMHAMAGELDMRRMSGLRRVLPVTHACIGIGCLALAGFPMVSGYFSKDDIIAAAFHFNAAVGALLLLTSGLTAYYTFRLFFRVFWGPLVLPGHGAALHTSGHEAHEDATASESAIATGTAGSSGVDQGAAHHAAPAQGGHGHDAHHGHEPLSMAIPLIVLAIGALLAGYLNWPPRAHGLAGFLGQSPSFVLGEAVAARDPLAGFDAGHFGLADPAAAQEPAFTMTMIVGGLVSIVGILVALVLHWRQRGLAGRLADALGPIVELVENKFFVDEIYQALIVEPLRQFARALFFIDRFLVDGMVNLTAWIPQLSGFTLKLTIQRGFLQGYATAMLFGIMVVLVIIFLR